MARHRIGPVKIGRGLPVPEDIRKEGVLLPFRAKNFRCSRPDGVLVKDMDGNVSTPPKLEKIEKAPEPVKIIEPKSEDELPDLENLSFKELRKLGRKHGVIDRSKKGLIREIIEKLRG